MVTVEQNYTHVIPLAVCSIADCGRPVKFPTFGLCGTHNTRRKQGLPMDAPIRRMSKSAEESFTNHTEWRGECLEWTGAVHGNGYGIIWTGKRIMRAHRWVFERAHGPIPNDADIDHRCSNRLCCNVDHLRVTTRKQNMENLRGAYEGSMSGVRGVSWDKRRNRWRVRVKHNYREYYGGSFQTIQGANEAAISLRNRLFTHNDRDRVMKEPA